jgi:stage V sporulation protein B
MLRILSFSIPPSAVHSCINGYFYGRKKTLVPSASQLLEQLVRVACVWLFSAESLAAGETPSINIAVLGLTVGEFFSCLLSLIALLPSLPAHLIHRRPPIRFHKPALLPAGSYTGFPGSSPGQLYRALFATALPLSANRIVLNLLQSVESVSIPEKLRLYGYDSVTALSVYGVLTGMAMPLIFFPNALTSSLSILLLPEISESYSLGDVPAIRSAVVRTIKYCGLLGFTCMAGFVLLGNFAGVLLFDSPLAGYFISTLGFLCPFLYLDTTLSGILQGLGMASRIFAANIICLLIRLGFVFGAVPRFGIRGYLWGLLLSQLVLGVLYLCFLHRFFCTFAAENTCRSRAHR